MAKYTVWICESNGSGTTHVSSHSAMDPEQAKRRAIAETMADWDYPEIEVHVLGVAKGDIELIEWNDLCD
jgi:hypothetical protein